MYMCTFNIRFRPPCHELKSCQIWTIEGPAKKVLYLCQFLSDLKKKACDLFALKNASSRSIERPILSTFKNSILRLLTKKLSVFTLGRRSGSHILCKIILILKTIYKGVMCPFTACDYSNNRWKPGKTR